MHAAIAAVLHAAPSIPDGAARVTVAPGRAGEWFGPTVLLVIALIIDATAAGPAAKRDRIAAVLTYAASLGYISIYRLDTAIQSWFSGSWSWQLTGSALAVLAHIAFTVTLLGGGSPSTKRLGTWIAGQVGIDSAIGNTVGRVNTRLHVYAAVVACTYVLARGDLAVVPRTIGTVVTAVGATTVNWLIARLGG